MELESSKILNLSEDSNDEFIFVVGRHDLVVSFSVLTFENGSVHLWSNGTVSCVLSESALPVGIVEELRDLDAEI